MLWRLMDGSVQVLAETGGATATAFEQIDKVSCFAEANIHPVLHHAFCRAHDEILAETVLILQQAPEEKARGITIATAHGMSPSQAVRVAGPSCL